MSEDADRLELAESVCREAERLSEILLPDDTITYEVFLGELPNLLKHASELRNRLQRWRTYLRDEVDTLKLPLSEIYGAQQSEDE